MGLFKSKKKAAETEPLNDVKITEAEQSIEGSSAFDVNKEVEELITELPPEVIGKIIALAKADIDGSIADKYIEKLREEDVLSGVSETELSTAAETAASETDEFETAAQELGETEISAVKNSSAERLEKLLKGFEAAEQQLDEAISKGEDALAVLELNFDEEDDRPIVSEELVVEVIAPEPEESAKEDNLSAESDSETEVDDTEATEENESESSSKAEVFEETELSSEFESESDAIIDLESEISDECEISTESGADFESDVTADFDSDSESDADSDSETETIVIETESTVVVKEPDPKAEALAAIKAKPIKELTNKEFLKRFSKQIAVPLIACALAGGGSGYAYANVMQERETDQEAAAEVQTEMLQASLLAGSKLPVSDMQSDGETLSDERVYDRLIATAASLTYIPQESSDVANTATYKAVYDAYQYSGTHLSASAGAVTGPNGRETYYNLDMSTCVAVMRSYGVYDTAWVRSDGCKMLGNYIMVAANLSLHPKGSIVKTSLGLGIVVDTGGFATTNPTQLDIATSW